MYRSLEILANLIGAAAKRNQSATIMPIIFGTISRPTAHKIICAAESKFADFNLIGSKYLLNLQDFLFEFQFHLRFCQILYGKFSPAMYCNCRLQFFALALIQWAGFFNPDLSLGYFH